MKQDNLNRIRGILSARQGTEIPKFDVGGPTVYKQYSYNGELVTEEEFLKRKAASNDTLQRFRDITGVGKRLNIRRLQESPIDNNLNNQTNSTPTTTNDPSLDQRPQQENEVVETVLRTEIPGALQTTPYTAVENAAKHNEISRQVVDNMIAERRAQAVELPEINVTAASPNTPIKVTPLQTAPLESTVDSSRIKLLTDQHQDKLKQETEKEAKQVNAAANIGKASVAAINTFGNAFGAAQAATDSNTTKNITAAWDGAAQIASQFGPVGEAIGSVMGLAKGAGDIMQAITGGTDQITKTDQWMSSPLLSWNIGAINDLFAKNTDSFGVDQNTLSTVGSSYGGAVSQINDAASKAGKKVGLFAGKERRDINTTISNARTNQAKMRGIADVATDQRLAVQSMGEQAGLAYSMMIDGGYNQKYTYAAKHGGLLEWNPVIEWEPQVELNWELPTFKEGGNIDINEELEWIPEFKDGGKTEESAVPETEETTQKNVIPEGALHKNKHHMEHAEGLTKKGIPVVDEDGEQQAEIEHSEIIFTLEVTKKLEEYYEIFYSEASTNKEKEQAALDAGKLLVYQILENTEDRTGLIESCKKGGSLTLKKSTDDLIEEVLEWMPTIVIVEEQKESKEEEHNKEEDKSEAKNEQSDKDKMKEAIREVLIELLLK